MNFRRVITALAVLALFAGLASAQIIVPQNVNCTASATSTPSIRSEGNAERVGDILLICSGGPTPTIGSAADRVTITVDLGVPVTSAGGAGAASEALIVIDEPGTVSNANAALLGITGYGPNATFSVGPQVSYSVCTTGACTAVVNNTANTGGGQTTGYWIMTAATGAVTLANPPTPLPAANAYQGTNGAAATAPTKVTFTGVPLVPPVASNVVRYYRITNLRVNPGTASAITATISVTAGTTNLATLAITGAPTVATVASGLTTSMSSVAGVSLCTSTQLAPGAGQAKANVALLSFKENFSTAFKTRMLPLSNAAGSALANGTAGTDLMNVVTGSYAVGTATVANFSETGLVPVTGYGQAAFGTRFKAVFTGLDANATYYVSAYPVIDFNNEVTAPTLGPGDQSAVSYAVVQNKGTGSTAPGTVETDAYTTSTAAVTLTNASFGAGVRVVPVYRSATGTGEVVWEVTNTQGGVNETMLFALYAVYNTLTPPTVGNTATVRLGFAPQSASSGTASTIIPRFNAPSAAAANFFNVLPCQTVLMFPYVTNVSGYETGMAISNTSKDPFGTPTSSGACSVYFYGANQPAGAMAFTDPANGNSTIAAGAMIANTATNLLNPTGTTTPIVNFNGYAIAVCNFQFAHGFAFVQNRLQTLGMGYLPLVLDTTIAASSSRGQTLVGEGLRP